MDTPRAPSRLESVIAQLWREILKVDAVALEDDFFRLGGESLEAIQMLAALEDVLLTHVDFPDFIADSTVSGLATTVETLRRPDHTGATASDGRDSPLRAEQAGAPPPCTFAQERLWFLDQLTGPNGAYNMPLGTRIRGPLDVDALEQALHEVVRRHNALRTTIGSVDGNPFLAVSDESPLEIEQRDLSAEPDPVAAAYEAVDAVVSLPFDLERGPLVRALLLRLGDQDHVLELVFDHTICDGWSHVVVFDELGTLYEGFRRGETPHLPPPTVQYDDHARRERQRLTDAVIEEKLGYWRRQLEGIPGSLELLTDRPRPPLPSFAGETLRTHLPEATAETIRSFARTEGATLFSTLLAVYVVLLQRYSEQETVVVGSTSAAREGSDLKTGVGLFASTVALRADLADGPSFRALVGRVRRTVLEAVANEDVPFDRLVADLAPERDPSRHPIFQVFFAHVPRITLAIEGAEPFDARPSKARFDLTLWVEEEAEGLDLVWEFSTDLFDRASVERLGRQFVCLLQSALRHPERPVAELELYAPEDRAGLIAGPATEGASFATWCLHTQFEKQAARAPDAVAVVHEGESMSYAELNDRANRLAHVLRADGVGPESLVALCLERSLDLVVAILAVLKAGGAYVPLDPSYPADRLAFALEDTAAPVLITQERLLDRVPARGVRVVCLDRDAALLAAAPSSNPDGGATPESAAYVIYTSGSTGRPKGVVVEHRNVARLFTATDSWFGFGAGDTWVLLHSYAFDFSVWELWGALLHGGKLVVASHWTTRSPASLRELLVTERVTVLNATPSLFLTVLDELVAAGETLSIRVVVFGGEALQPPTVRPWFERFGRDDTRLVNMYGITETTVHVTYRRITAGDAEREVSPIGEPIPDLRTYVLDARLEPVPEGVPGELFVGGAGVARGYLNRPDLDAQRFLPSPFGDGRLYRTGDRARRVGGELFFLGRADDQVKIRGFRIELGEIDAVLAEHPGVASVATIVREDTPGDRRLVAYLATGGGVVDGDELRNHAESRLPAFMVPAAFVSIDRLPLTTNGKLDRVALPAPVIERSGETPVGLATPTQERIAAIWRDVLGLEEVGAGDHFFHLGGHSLLAARVVTKVRDAFGVALSVRALFDHPVLSEFAADVDSRCGDAPADTTSAAATAADTESPLSFQQRQLYFLDDLSEGAATYNAALAYRVRGPLDVGALGSAARLLVERHEALRTVIRTSGTSAEQVVLEDWELSLEEVDGTGRSAEDLPALLREIARRPFDLRHDVLLRAFVVRLGTDDHVVLFQTHHIAFDAWAVDIFLRELGHAYDALRSGGTPELPPLPTSYRDFARWQRAAFDEARLRREEDFWRGYLAGAPTFLPIAPELPRPESLESDRLEFLLPAALLPELRSLCADEDVTPYMVLLAAFATLLYRETGHDDILLGGPSSNRARSDFDGVVGFFANTIVTRVELRGNPTFRDLLARTRRSVLEALDHQELPLERVVDAVKPDRRSGVNPLFQVNFRTRIGAPPSLELDGTTAERITIDVGLARFDLALEAHVLDDGIAVELLFATALFDRPRVERLADAFATLLAAALADPDRTLLAFELPVVSEIVEPATSIRGFRAAQS